MWSFLSVLHGSVLMRTLRLAVAWYVDYTEIPCGRKYVILQYMIMHIFCITKTL